MEKMITIPYDEYLEMEKAHLLVQKIRDRITQNILISWESDAYKQTRTLIMEEFNEIFDILGIKPEDYHRDLNRILFIRG